MTNVNYDERMLITVCVCMYTVVDEKEDKKTSRFFWKKREGNEDVSFDNTPGN